MINSFLRIITWNANGLNQRAHELEIFLHTNNIDIALISETHFSNKNHFKIRGFDSYWTTHPSERARGGSAVLIKSNIKHYQQENIRENYIQATVITIQFNDANLNIMAAYCPPRHTPTKSQFIQIFKNLGPRFIIGGDYNIKHTVWGSRLVSPGKGNELLRAINESKCDYMSSGGPTYWPTDTRKIPDLLDFFISKGIPLSLFQAEGIHDLTSDHTPVLLSLKAKVITEKQKQKLTNKYTDWVLFREELVETLNLKVCLKTHEELEQQTIMFIENIRLAASHATPVSKYQTASGIKYPAEIRQLIKERRKARRIWHCTRNPSDKTLFNRASNKVNKLIKYYKQESFDRYLSGLSPDMDKDYSLWKATRLLKRPITRIPPLRNPQGIWVRQDHEKAELFAQHLKNVFKPHDIKSNIVISPTYQLDQDFKRVTPMEIAKAIDNNLNPKKAPGIDGISPGLFKELPRKAIIMLAHLFNACIRLNHVPSSFKTAQIIMLLKPNKPDEEVSSYRPISLLPTIAKLFEKVILKRLKPLLNIPDFQFGFRNKHSTIDQVHRITKVIKHALEQKKYCPAVFLDVSQAFDRVWHEGLIHKMSKMFPRNYCKLMESYLSDRKFRVIHGEAYSEFYPTEAGVPQGSVLGPFLYLLFTADIPTTEDTFIGTFADDTVIMSTDESQPKAVEKLQRALNNVSRWTTDWKIKLNEQKSVHVTFTLRRKNNNIHTYINGRQVPQAESTKYLGLHLDSKLNWKHHVRQKAEQIRIKQRQLYWLIGHHSKMNLYCKRLVYQSILMPIWIYGVQLWGCTHRSNRDLIQRTQNKILRMITNAYRFVTNEEIHKDLKIKKVEEIIREFAIKHEMRLLAHPNFEATQLLDTTNEIRRLKRLTPHDLTM